MSTEALLRDLENRLPEGAEDPYPAWALASDLGISTRTVQELVGDLIDRGVLVGSVCGKEHGYFIVTNRDELEAGTRHIVSRARSSLARVSKLRRAAEKAFGPDVLTLFDVEEAMTG